MTWTRWEDVDKTTMRPGFYRCHRNGRNHVWEWEHLRWWREDGDPVCLPPEWIVRDPVLFPDDPEAVV